MKNTGSGKHGGNWQGWGDKIYRISNILAV